MEAQKVQQSASLSTNIKLKSATLKLNDGNTIPIIGLGTHLLSRTSKYFRSQKVSPQQLQQDQKENEREEAQFKQAVITAVKCGYRHIDTAQVYRTEKVVASALKELYAANIITRKDIFITTKISRTIRKPQAIRDSISQSLSDLDVKYIDLMLIHSPHTTNNGADVILLYKILHEYRRKGIIRSVGVSNFNVAHLEILARGCASLSLPLPACNQIECHPFLQETAIIDYCRNKGIIICSYSPLAHAEERLVQNAILTQIAVKYNKTWSAIMLRWQIQSGFLAIPKSVTPKRIVANGDLFEFEIDASDMAKLNALRKEHIRVDWNCVNEIKWVTADEEKEAKSDDKKGIDLYVNKLKENLENRSGKKALEDKNILAKSEVADSLQATVKSLESQQKKDKLKQVLEIEVDENELYSKGIKKNKGMADSLQDNAVNLVREQKKDKLAKGMRGREDANKLAERGILGSPTVADSLQATVKTLETQQKKDKLKQSMADRVEEKELYEAGIKKNKGMADSLQDNASNLALAQKKDKLNQGMTARKDEKELYEAGIKKNKGMADSLQDNASNLAHEQKKDKLAKGMRDREDPNKLTERGILGSPTVADSLQATVKTLETQQKKDKLKQGMADRSDEKELYEAGIKKNKGMADSLQDNATNLVREQKKDKLAKGMRGREDANKLTERGILGSPTVADSLQATVKTLETQQKKDKLKQNMADRVEEKELYEAGIKKNKGMADSLQDNATNLARAHKRDKLSKGMRARSDSNKLAELGILGKQTVADSLQATVKTLETQQKKDKLKQFLEVEEVDEETLYSLGIKKNRGISPALQANADSLKNSQRKDTLNAAMKNRSAVDELENRGILKTGINDYDDQELAQETQNIINSLTDDELNNLKRALESDIKENNSDYDPQIYVYLNGIIGGGGGGVDAEEEDNAVLESPNTQQTMEDIFKDVDDNNSNILKDSSIQKDDDKDDKDDNDDKDDDDDDDGDNAEVETADSEAKEDKMKKLSENLENRPDKQQLKQQNILVAGNGVAPTLQQNAIKLEKQQKKDKLKQGINDRMEEKELYQAGIKKNKGVADSLQPTANALEQQQKKEKLKADLDNRSTQKDLKDKGIIYSQTMASSLQPNANELEAQLLELKQLTRKTSTQNLVLEAQSLQQQDKISKLQEIIQRKAKEIEAMKSINDKQKELINNLDIEAKEEKQEQPEQEYDFERCLQILSALNTEIASFEANYNKLTLNEIGSENIDELVNPNSTFHNTLDKYLEIIASINICSDKFKNEIISIKKYIFSTFIPNIEHYKEWDLAEIILWIKSLENGRFVKYLDILSYGFKESEITGEELPDLSTADLSVTPFNIKIFKDKRDIIKNFQRLIADHTANENEANANAKPMGMLISDFSIGKDTNEVVESIMKGLRTQEADDKVSDLSSVNEQGPSHIPFNSLTEYQETELYGQYAAIRRDIINMLDDVSYDDGSWGPILVRLAWNASGTYDESDNSGGPNGASMRCQPEMDDIENVGLEIARSKLETIKAKYAEISYADLWIFASYIAIESMGGPYMKFSGGRTDDKAQSLCPAQGRLPSATDDSSQVRAVFYRMGFDDREIVALIGGGHALGRCHADRSGYDGTWVDTPIKFSNAFFEELFENEWEERKVGESGKVQFKDKSDELMMLPTDMLLIRDDGFRKWAEIYYKDKHRFFKDFGAAYKKLTELGCDGLKEDGLVDSSRVTIEKIMETPKIEKVEEAFVD